MTRTPTPDTPIIIPLRNALKPVENTIYSKIVAHLQRANQNRSVDPRLEMLITRWPELSAETKLRINEVAKAEE